MKPTLLILAAGMGSRYGSLKQLEAVGPSGESIMDYSIYDAKRAGFGKILFVIRKSFEENFLKKIIPKYQDFITVDYVLQNLDDLPNGFTRPKGRKKPWGTAHAVWVAAYKIHENFAVINADDFYGKTAYQSIYAFLKNTATQNTNYCLLTYNLKNTTSTFGSVSRGICTKDKSEFLESIEEHSQIYIKRDKIYSNRDSKQIELDKNTPISMNFMGFTPQVFPYLTNLFISFLRENIEKPKAEFFLPTVLAHLIENKKARIQTIATDEQWFGVTYREDKEKVVKSINAKIAQGVYPSNLFKIK